MDCGTSPQARGLDSTLREALRHGWRFAVSSLVFGFCSAWTEESFAVSSLVFGFCSAWTEESRVGCRELGLYGTLTASDQPRPILLRLTAPSVSFAVFGCQPAAASRHRRSPGPAIGSQPGRLPRDLTPTPGTNREPIRASRWRFLRDFGGTKVWRRPFLR